jgi:5-methylcytosine-specific restriction protein A
MAPTSRDFQNALENLFAKAMQENKPYIEIISGNLHREVGGYPGQNHRMPICCSVMKKNMLPGDEIIYMPPSGKGATLTIRYKLPR